VGPGASPGGGPGVGPGAVPGAGPGVGPGVGPGAGQVKGIKMSNKPTYMQHRYECLVCKHRGKLRSGNWLEGGCTRCNSDMILPEPDISIVGNVVSPGTWQGSNNNRKKVVDNANLNVAKYVQSPYKAKRGQGNNRELTMKIVKLLKNKIDEQVQDKFGTKIKTITTQGTLQQMGALQLEIAKYKHETLHTLQAALSQFQAVEGGIASVEETETHFLFTSQVSSAGKMTVGLEKAPLKAVLGDLL